MISAIDYDRVNKLRTFIGNWFDYLLVSQDEMENIVEGTGWRIDRFFNARERPGIHGIDP
jgi:hypothetical protein